MGKALTTVALLNWSRVPASARRPGLLRRAVRLGLGRKKLAEAAVVFLTDAEIRRLNKKHLEHDYATDVIAFDTGDIAISVDRARAQAAELGHPLLVELLTLAAHGALHLAGYDDHAPKDRARMFKRQDEIVRTLTKRP